MSIYINGMEMPDDCYSCPFRELADRDTDICIITGERFSALFTLNKQKSADCPLIKIPPHGRLIDADKFERIKYEIPIKPANYSRGFHEGVQFVQKLIMDAPTIIPADEEG